MYASLLAMLRSAPSWPPEARASLERRCTELLEHGAKAHPGLRPEPELLAEGVAMKIDAADSGPLEWESVGPVLDALDGESLYLAASCAAGQPLAIQRFESLYFRNLPAVLTAMGAQAADVDDVIAVVREKLFVAPPDGRPRVLEFAGQGSLAKLCRVIAARTLLNRQRSHRRQRIAGDDDLADLLTPNDDPELAAIKQHHRDAFRSAFAEAIAKLSSEERNMLRLSLVHRLSIDEVGRIYRIHRSTAARRLGKLRDTIAQHTRTTLRLRLGADQRELQSLFRLVQTGLDKSFVRLLGESVA